MGENGGHKRKRSEMNKGEERAKTSREQPPEQSEPAQSSRSSLAPLPKGELPAPPPARSESLQLVERPTNSLPPSARAEPDMESQSK